MAASPSNGKTVQMTISPAKPNPCSSARPNGPPTAKAPYMPIPASDMTLPDRAWPI